MLGPDGRTEVCTVSGFATAESAQGFIRDVFIGLMVGFGGKGGPTKGGTN